MSGHYENIHSPIASSPNPVKRARHTATSTPNYGSPTLTTTSNQNVSHVTMSTSSISATTINTFSSPKLLHKTPPTGPVNISITSPVPGRSSGEGTKRKSEDISPSESYEESPPNNGLNNNTSVLSATFNGNNDRSGYSESSLLGTFFSPVLQYFGGSAAPDTRREGSIDENDPNPQTMEELQQQQQNGCDSKWETKDDRDMESAVVSMPSHARQQQGSAVGMSFSSATSSSSSSGSDVQMEEEEDENVAPINVPANITTTTPTTTDHDQYRPQVRPAEEEDEDEVPQEEFNPYAFIKGLPPYSKVVPPNKPRPCLLPSQKMPSKPTLVLDLDETLVHCSIDPIPNPDLTFKVDFNGILYDVYVRKRPCFQQFLEHVSRSFEVIVFTASQQVYAEALLNILDPSGTLIHHRLYRDACLCVEGNYLKDLTILGRDLSKTVLVDNSPHAFGYQIDNGIPIESWFDDDNDTELAKLSPFLDRLHNVEDVRSILRQQFQLRAVVEAQRL